MTVLSVADARTHLDIGASVTDQEIQDWIDASVQMIEGHLNGPAENRAIVETVQLSDWGRSLVLTSAPFVSLTSITADGQPVSMTDVYVSPGRVLRRRYGLAFMPIYAATWVVSYTAGWGATAPPVVKSAAKVIVADFWATRRGPSTRRGDSANIERNRWLGAVMPDRAVLLLDTIAPETGLA
jgi:hypothetical protein